MVEYEGEGGEGYPRNDETAWEDPGEAVETVEEDEDRS